MRSFLILILSLSIIAHGFCQVNAANKIVRRTLGMMNHKTKSIKHEQTQSRRLKSHELVYKIIPDPRMPKFCNMCDPFWSPNLDMHIDETTGDWGMYNGIPKIMSSNQTNKASTNQLKFSWWQTNYKYAKIIIRAFAPWELNLQIAKLTINGNTSRARTIEIQSESKGRTIWKMDLSVTEGILNTKRNSATLEFVSGDGQLFIESVDVTLFNLVDLEDIMLNHTRLQNESYDSSIRYINALQGTRTMIEAIKQEVVKHELATDIAKTTGDVIMIGGAVLAIFTFGTSALVAGAIGGTINVAAGISDWYSSSSKSKDITNAMTHLTEFQSDFKDTFSAFKDFATSISMENGLTIAPFMAIMKNLGKFGTLSKGTVTALLAGKNTISFFQAMKNGESAANFAARFQNSGDLAAISMKVGAEFAPETMLANTSAFQRTAIYFGETSIGKGVAIGSSMLTVLGPLISIADIVYTWVSHNPNVQNCDDQIKIIDEVIPQLKNYATSIKPEKNEDLVSILEKAQGKTSRRLGKVWKRSLGNLNKVLTNQKYLVPCETKRCNRLRLAMRD